MNKAEYRIKIIFIFFILCLFVLCVRLFLIQVVGIEEAKNVFSSQAKTQLSGFSMRGNILDRNGKLLVNRSDAYYIFIDKTKLNEAAKECLRAFDSEELMSDSRRYVIYKTESYNEYMMKRLKSEWGGIILEFTQRYSSPQPAVHLIGYCNRVDNIGTFGLEREFDERLSVQGGLRAKVDAAGRILSGYGISYVTEEKGEDIRTTLDYDIQCMAERILEGNAPKGAAVVIIDADSGGVLCSASYPTYNPNKLLEARGSSLLNRALQTSYPPGSIFKIIVAVAAIENSLAKPEDVFHCSGKEAINGITISCSKEEGHGDISLEDAFAKSCNCVFIQLGQAIGAELLIETAQNLGLGSKTLSCLKEESCGNLPDRYHVMGAGIGNLSIGQGEVEMTCIQAAKLSSIIALNGRDPGIYLIDGEENKSKGRRIISLKTAIAVKRMMYKVVEEGTGQRAGADSAGKSGSPQSSSEGKRVTHGWYTGFFPRGKPKYIVAVFTQESGGASCAVKIFSEIYSELSKGL